ncbi:hypothetical protein [Portibacter marinus]|uniref:hypothetical protein n=1 Tax=Portibacter marinus TaxID=2898660 RepID=UPI001F465945|nr:hypothetical protein [Portibacter marinus]
MKNFNFWNYAFHITLLFIFLLTSCSKIEHTNEKKIVEQDSNYKISAKDILKDPILRDSIEVADEYEVLNRSCTCNVAITRVTTSLNSNPEYDYALVLVRYKQNGNTQIRLLGLPGNTFGEPQQVSFNPDNAIDLEAAYEPHPTYPAGGFWVKIWCDYANPGTGGSYTHIYNWQTGGLGWFDENFYQSGSTCVITPVGSSTM